jgi:hypothetical protein
MTKMKTLNVVIILSAALATPVFAQDAGMPGPESHYGFGPQPGPTYHGRVYDRGDYREAYNQLNGPFYAAPRTQDGWNIENFGYSGRDPSRPGGEDPSLRPSGS